MDAYDSALVSVLAYAGLRPGELLGLQWRDVQQRTLLIARSADLDARELKTTKTGSHRSVRLLVPLAADLAEWRLQSGRPQATASVFPAADGQPWHKSDWSNWRNRRWKPGLKAAGLPAARPYVPAWTACEG